MLCVLLLMVCCCSHIMYDYDIVVVTVLGFRSSGHMLKYKKFCFSMRKSIVGSRALEQAVWERLWSFPLWSHSKPTQTVPVTWILAGSSR